MRRRALLGAVPGVAAALATASCLQEPHARTERSAVPYARGRLAFRPGTGSAPAQGERPARTGLVRLGSSRGGEALAWVPPGDGRGLVHLVVVLHGAGGDAERAVQLLRPEAERHGLLLLAPKSAAATWDVIRGGYGPDVRRLDELLEEVAESRPVGSCSIAGFSDGASYALSLALANGDVFESCVAFSPGFTAATEHVGRPRFFVSHGTGDRVLPIDRCSRRIVPGLRREGYDVEYVEFAGGHEVPPGIRSRAAEWLSG